MEKTYYSDRLILKTMQTSDAPFILELLNTPGWKEFIGDRNVFDLASAVQYIENIANNPATSFWVVKTKDTQELLGVVSLIQRTYLPSPDIGFAFLPEFGKKGYAFEAANCILENIKKDTTHSMILATTLHHNLNSRRLLERLGLVYIQDILVDNENLRLYSSDKELTKIDFTA